MIEEQHEHAKHNPSLTQYKVVYFLPHQATISTIVLLPVEQYTIWWYAMLIFHSINTSLSLFHVFLYWRNNNINLPLPFTLYVDSSSRRDRWICGHRKRCLPAGLWRTRPPPLLPTSPAFAPLPLPSSNRKSKPHFSLPHLDHPIRIFLIFLNIRITFFFMSSIYTGPIVFCWFPSLLFWTHIFFLCLKIWRFFFYCSVSVDFDVVCD